MKNGFTSNYEGKTTLDLPYQGNPSLPNYQACLTPGPKDMVGWSWMDLDVLGRTCKEITFWNTLGITKTRSSIVLNQFLGWYTGLDPADCTGEVFDLKATVTHEVGHSLGLGHYEHQGQAMFRSQGYCDINKRGLGYGDVHGVAEKYPAN